MKVHKPRRASSVEKIERAEHSDKEMFQLVLLALFLQLAMLGLTVASGPLEATYYKRHNGLALTSFAAGLGGMLAKRSSWRMMGQHLWQVVKAPRYASYGQAKDALLLVLYGLIALSVVVVLDMGFLAHGVVGIGGVAGYSTYRIIRGLLQRHKVRREG